MLQSLSLHRKLLLALLQFRDIRVNGHRPAIVGLPLAHKDPATVAALLHERRTRVAVPCEALFQPLLESALRIVYVTTLGGAPDQALECRADEGVLADARENERPILAVAGYQPVLVVV